MIEKLSDGSEQEYEIYSLVDKFDPALSTVTPEFNFTNPVIKPRYLAVSLLRTMMKNRGVGLAAPQCGLLHRVFVMGAPGGNGYACFNPKILKTEGEVDFEEGCLTYTGLFLRIKRPETITVEYQDMDGTKHNETFSGLTSRTYQHELDHLNGIVYTSLVDRYTLDKAKGKVKNNLKKLKRQWLEAEKQALIQQAMRNLQEKKRLEELNKAINIEIPDLEIKIDS